MTPRTHFIWTNPSGTWSIEKLVGPSNWSSWLSDLRTMLGPSSFLEIDPSLFKFSFEQQALLKPTAARDEMLGTIYLVVGAAEYQWIVMQALTPYHAMRMLQHRVEDEWARMQGAVRCRCPACGSSARTGGRGRADADRATFKPTLHATNEFQSRLVRRQSSRSLLAPPQAISERTVSESSLFASPAGYRHASLSSDEPLGA